MIYLITDKDHNIKEIITIGVPSFNDEETNVYPMEPHQIPTHIISDLSSYKFDGFTFVKLDKKEIRQKNIDEYKSRKINVLSKICNKLIVNGIDYDGKHYSLDTEDQMNISRLGLSASNESNTQTLVYHADGEQCRVYTKQEILGIYDKANAWITYLTTYYNLCKQWVMSISDVDEVLNVNFNSILPEPFKSELNDMIDISSYDFDTNEIVDTTDYSFINPTIDATECIEDYKKEMQRKEQELLDKMK